MHYFRSTFALLVLSLSSPCPFSVPSLALFRATTKTQFSVVIGVRPGAFFRQNGPGTAAEYTFSQNLIFVVFYKNMPYFVFRGPGGTPGTLRAPSGGAPGPPQTDHGYGHFETSCPSCFAVGGGRPAEHQTVNHDGNLCRKPSSPLWAPFEVQNKTWISVVFRARFEARWAQKWPLASAACTF